MGKAKGLHPWSVRSIDLGSDLDSKFLCTCEAMTEDWLWKGLGALSLRNCGCDPGGPARLPAAFRPPRAAKTTRAPVMGTPASVVSEPPLWQVSTAQPRDRGRGRKQASANIFQDAELVQIQGLFQRSGDQLAEERAQIIWECAGDHRVAEALRRLRRKRPPRQNHCSRLRVPELGSTAADPQASTTDTASSEQFGNSRRTSARVHRNWNKPGPTGYLHQIRH